MCMSSSKTCAAVCHRAEVNSISERLYYENVIRELGDSSEILYLSVANAALAHLPYLIALDHQSRQCSYTCSYQFVVLPCAKGSM